MGSCRRGKWVRCIACEHGVGPAQDHMWWSNQYPQSGPKTEYMAMAIKRAAASLPEGRVGTLIPVGLLPKKYPTVYEYLTEEKYEDGTERRTSTINIFAEGGMIKLCFNDRDAGRTGWASGPSFEDAMAVLEKRLSDDTLEWRLSDGKRKGKGK